MKANITHISFETAKLLKYCKVGVQNEWYFILFNDNSTQSFNSKYENGDWIQNDVIPAYTWQEILWEYPKEFFGDKLINNKYWEDKYDVFDGVDYYYDGGNELSYTEIAYKRHSRIIVNLLQQKKYDEADEYFRSHCILIIR
jgi:hypothetical protein